MDLLALADESPPWAGQELEAWVLGASPEALRVIPAAVETLHRTYFKDGQVRSTLPPLPAASCPRASSSVLALAASSSPPGAAESPCMGESLREAPPAPPALLRPSKLSILSRRATGAMSVQCAGSTGQGLGPGKARSRSSPAWPTRGPLVLHGHHGGDHLGSDQKKQTWGGDRSFVG